MRPDLFWRGTTVCARVMCDEDRQDPAGPGRLSDVAQQRHGTQTPNSSGREGTRMHVVPPWHVRETPPSGEPPSAPTNVGSQVCRQKASLAASAAMMQT